MVSRNWESAITDVCIGGSFRRHRHEIVRIIESIIKSCGNTNRNTRWWMRERISHRPRGTDANFAFIVSSILAWKRLAELRSIDPHTFPSVRLPRVFIGRLDGRLLPFYPCSPSLEGERSFSMAQKTNPFLRLFPLTAAKWSMRWFTFREKKSSP